LEIGDYSEIHKRLSDWTQSISDNITWSDSFSAQVSNVTYHPQDVPKRETYLNSYLEDLAVLSHLTDSLFYSTTMEASSAFSPIIRGSEKVMFLQNIDETMAKAAYELFQNNQSGFTFLYDDDNSIKVSTSKERNTNHSAFFRASLITFATSSTYAPTSPNPFYNPAWKTSALYLDGLTYITQNGTQIVGSYVRDRNPVMVVTSINSTISGRIIRVGITKYPPFFNNGDGFSVPILSKLATAAGIHYTTTFYNATPDKPYYAAMEEAIIKNEIDAGLTPMPMVAVQNGNVTASHGSLTISYILLRQRQRRPSDYLLILRPLAMPVWLASCFLAFIFAGLLMLFGHLKPVIMRNLAEGEMITKTDLFGVSSLGVASSFSLTKLQIIPTTLSSRIFALIMWLFSYLLLVLYASAMMTILLRIQKPINDDITVDDVLHPTKCDSLIVLKNGIAYDQIVTFLTESQRSFTPVDDIQTAYNELMKSQKTVLLASSIEASYISVMDCELEKIPYTEAYDFLVVFPYNSGWEFGSAFNDYLTKMDDGGVFSNAAAVYFETGPCYHPPYKVPLPAVLELGDTTSIYIFLLVGILVSFIFLGIELFLKHRKDNKLSKVSFLPCEVNSERNGIYVKVANWPDTVFIPNSQLHPDPLKVYNALDLGLSEGEPIEVVYFGKNADQVTELFCRYCSMGLDDDTH
uniref:PBPe domain-containing protein n=1 Tax=Hymenolepis diminuta TaxID=6216 RepID=A0A0R3SGV4_HYMDI